MTIPTTNKAITETPANTPKPIGNTSSFFPGGSTAAWAWEVALGDGDDRGKSDVRDEGGLTVGEVVLSGSCPVGSPVLPGCGLTVGFGTEETPYKKS